MRGVHQDGLRIWRGVPYARPPVGPLRHRRPYPVEPWAGVRSTTQFAHRAMQAESANVLLGPATWEPDCDEDCLYLNITAPDGPVPPGGYPVLVWIHGGGYLRGSGAGGSVGDGDVFARRGIVVVTFNYRLGAFGFLPLADVLGDGEADAGTAGLLDQIAVLRWVRDNIAAFGGDPRQVTAYGVSAGAKSVANILASPLAMGLVTRAISSSGGGEHVATFGQGVSVRRRLFTALGLADSGASAIRDVPAEELLGAQESLASGTVATWIWRPCLGTPALPVRPIDAIAEGSATGVALLAGNNGNEGATYQAMERSSAAQAPRVLSELFGYTEAAAVLRGYSAARPELDETGVLLAVLGDERYGIPTHRFAQAQAGRGPVWRYRMDSSPPGVPAALAGGHGLDTAMIWSGDITAILNDPRARLCTAMVDAWARFARGAEPAGDGGSLLGRWDRYTVVAQQTMILDIEPHLESAPRAAVTALWDGRTWQSGTWWQIEGVS